MKHQLIYQSLPYEQTPPNLTKCL